MDSTVGTPVTRSVKSDLRPCRQSAELQTWPRAALITSARYFAPTLKVQVLASVETTLTSKTGLAYAG